MLSWSPPIWLLVPAFLLGLTRLAAQDPADFFEKRIRPVLVEHCYECHSAESKKLKGGLMLDTRAGVQRGGDSGAVLISGQAEKSRLIEAVRYHNRDLQMPPQGKLPETVIADLEQWVKDGATDPREGSLPATLSLPPSSATTHWAFQPFHSPVPPAVSPTSLALRSPIDRFLRAGLDVAGLAPTPRADRSTLVRRAYFDLIGLPPTPAEMAALVDDQAPDALARLVDRLLASPRYGERWGRWWLDLARYADSNGQDENKVMANAWRYRDWVIRAFNANQPFDQFTIDQLAGDLLPTNGVTEEVIFDRWTATGILVLGPKMLAEQDKPKLVMDLVDEQIDVVTRAFLGLTVGCARCHDHKFDPIPTRDYYALAGIFKSTRTMENLNFVSKFNERPVSTREQLAVLAAHEQAMSTRKEALQAAVAQANSELKAVRQREFPSYLSAALELNSREPAAGASPTSLDSVRLKRLTELVRLDPATNGVSRSLRELAAAPGRLAQTLRDLESAKDQAGLRIGPGRVGGAFVGTGSNYLELAHTAALDPAQLTVEAWIRTGEFPKEGDARRWLVNKNGNEWVDGHYALMLDRDRPGAYLNLGEGKENVFALWSDGPKLKTNHWHHLAFTYDGVVLRLFVDGKPAGDVRLGRSRNPGTTPLALGRRQDGYVNFRGSLDEVQVFDRALSQTELAAHFAKPGQGTPSGRVASWTFNDLTEAEQRVLAQAELREALWGTDGILSLPADPRPVYPAETQENLARLERERDALKATAPSPVGFALAVTEDKPVDLPVFVRGSHLNPGPSPVPRGFIQVAYRGEPPQLPAHQSGRLELARWLTSPENPLTARVIVNRVWQAHFGEGLVRTPDNFGRRGEPPTHPELLDWLASEFIRSGWDLKQLHRLILNSAVWQQDSKEIIRRPTSNETSLTPSHLPVPSSIDPENRLLAHFPRQRLEAEMVRDALLAVSGRLDWLSGGSLVTWTNDEYVPNDDSAAKSVRRSVYLPIVRDQVYDVFTIFDFANPSVGTAKRTPTVVSHQALFFLNSPLVKDCAQELAETLLVHAGSEADRVHHAYERCLSRPPTPAEAERAYRFLASKEFGGGPNARLDAWSAFCQTLFAANEFLYRE